MNILVSMLQFNKKQYKSSCNCDLIAFIKSIYKEYKTVHEL